MLICQSNHKAMEGKTNPDIHTQSDKKPGAVVSVDQIFSPTQGFIAANGRTLVCYTRYIVTEGKRGEDGG